uniref:Ionotropic glutamate receptor C-terminal domain-containing protein n=1 Tax=Tetranychus urticae TaxID=32264 RepID=T1JZM8_TETUR
MDFQFKIGFVERGPTAIFDPIRNKFTGPIGHYLNAQIGRYSSINYTLTVFNETFGGCDSVNCTGLIGHIQRGDVDFGERLYSFTSIPDSIIGLKPGPASADVACSIVSFLPEVGTMREDVFKSLSIFTLDAIIFLAFLFLFLFSIPFLLWYFNRKSFNIKTNSPPIIWPLICAILNQGSNLKTLFNRQSLSFIWMSITLTIFFMTALYSSSFTTDLTSKAPMKMIDSLEDVADSDRIPMFMEEPLCRVVANSSSPRAQREIARRGLYKTTGKLLQAFYDGAKLENYVFIVDFHERNMARLGYCVYNPGLPMLQWHQATGSFPVDLLFTVMHSQLSPHATKIIDLLHQKQFESHILFHLVDKWKAYVENVIDPERKFGCLHKTSISPTPALNRFNQLHIQNYKLSFKYFLCMISTCILSLLGEYLYAEINSVMSK